MLDKREGWGLGESGGKALTSSRRKSWPKRSLVAAVARASMPSYTAACSPSLPRPTGLSSPPPSPCTALTHCDITCPNQPLQYQLTQHWTTTSSELRCNLIAPSRGIYLAALSHCQGTNCCQLSWGQQCYFVEMPVWPHPQNTKAEKGRVIHFGCKPQAVQGQKSPHC